MPRGSDRRPKINRNRATVPTGPARNMPKANLNLPLLSECGTEECIFAGRPPDQLAERWLARLLPETDGRLPLVQVRAALKDVLTGVDIRPSAVALRFGALIRFSTFDWANTTLAIDVTTENPQGRGSFKVKGGLTSENAFEGDSPCVFSATFLNDPDLQDKLMAWIHGPVQEEMDKRFGPLFKPDATTPSTSGS